MKFHGYCPNYCTEFDLPSFEFSDISEVLEHPFVKRWVDGRFHKFSYSENHLMVELYGGKEWWVLGTIEGPIETLGIPQWVPVKYTFQEK